MTVASTVSAFDIRRYSGGREVWVGHRRESLRPERAASSGQGPVPAHLLVRLSTERVAPPPSIAQRLLKLLAGLGTDGLTVAEAAAELDLPNGTVKEILSRLEDDGDVCRFPVPAGEARERRGRFQYSNHLSDSEDELETDEDRGEAA